MYPYIVLHDKQTKKKRSIDVTQIKTWTDGAVELYDHNVYEVVETHDFIEKMLDATYKEMGTDKQMGGTHEQDAQHRLDVLNEQLADVAEKIENLRHLFSENTEDPENIPESFIEWIRSGAKISAEDLEEILEMLDS